MKRPVAEDPDLLGDELDVLAVEAVEDHRLGRLVDRRRDVAALALADRPLALVAAGHLLEHAPHVVRARRGRARSQGPQATGKKSRPEVSFG